MKDTKTRLLGLTLSATFILSSLAPAVASASEEDVTHASYPANSYTSSKNYDEAKERVNNTSDYEDLKAKLIEQGYTLQDDKFELEEFIYTKVQNNDGTLGLIEEDDNQTTLYLFKDNGDGTYTLTARDNNDNEIYKVVDKNGKPAELSHTEDFDEGFENPNINIIPLKTSACEWGVGMSGAAISTIYGTAFGLAFGPGVGAAVGAAASVGWIPVSSACK